MEPLTTSTFALPDTLAAKADPALIAADEQHFAAITASLAQSIAELTERLDAERRSPGVDPQPDPPERPDLIGSSTTCAPAASAACAVAPMSSVAR